MPAVHEQELKKKLEEIWQSGGAGRDALRKEFSKLGIVWYVLGDYESLLKRQHGRKPFIGSGNFLGGAQRLTNGNTMICDYGGSAVYEVTPDWEIVWEYGEYGVPGSDEKHFNGCHYIQVDEDRDTVLVSDAWNGRVMEIRRSDKKVLRTLSKIDSGSLHGVHSAVYTDRGILVAILSSHYVAEVDWDGHELWSWGSWGTSGHTESPQRLYYPTAAFQYDDRYLITDYSNDRVLCVREDGSVAWRLVSLSPECAQPSLDRMIGVGGSDPCFWIDRYGVLRGYIPHSGEYFQSTIDGTWILSSSTVLYEFDPTLLRPYVLPSTGMGLSSYSLPANESVGPIYSGADHIERFKVSAMFPYEKLTFYVRSSQPATFEPLVSRGSIGRFEEWIPIDSISLSANTWEIYTFSGHAHLASFRITMGGTGGTVDVFISRLPKCVS